VFLQINSAPGTFIGLIPVFDAVEGGNGTLGFKLKPSEALHSRSGQAVEQGLKAGWPDRGALRVARFGLTQAGRVSKTWRLVRDSCPRHRVVKLLAIAADNALDGKVEPPIGAT
jgi:hypothetical protein